jgi:hypothetical protein
MLLYVLYSRREKTVHNQKIYYEYYIIINNKQQIMFKSLLISS